MTRERAILPLPADVVAQIKSSTAIVSLAGVVLELLKNALDAQATKVDATVDFARGACIVQDDGLGIAPLEFAEDGGLGKLHYTSKHHAHGTLLGRNGAFLASLSAVSLLCITSRHHRHRSHNSLTYHHARPVDRQMPAAAHSELPGEHGTRVTVRNLFGNQPVRVKQRARLFEDSMEHGRLWTSLKANVTGLLLSWGGRVSLKCRDADNHVIFNFNTTDAAHATETRVDRQPSTRLNHLLTVLTQADCISVDNWASWVPASASVDTISISGAISLDPAPTRSVQFISFGVRPILSELQHNELYSHINRLFRLSDFGSLDEDAGVSGLDTSSRQLQESFRRNGSTKEPMRARKGVDKHPMFHLRISLHERRDTSLQQYHDIEDEANLHTIVQVLEALITQWLSAHHFRPSTRQQQAIHSSRPRALCTYQIARESVSPSKSHSNQSTVDRVTSATKRSRGYTPRNTPTKRHQPATAGSTEPSRSTRRNAFADWSRIKSGKADFFSPLVPHPSYSEMTAEALAVCKPDDKFKQTTSHRPSATAAGIAAQPVPQESTQDRQACQPLIAPQELVDGAIRWTDPLTRKSHLLNDRTGCVIPEASLALRGPAVMSTFPSAFPDSACSSQPQIARNPLNATSWLDTVLKAWDNPVFSNAEKPVEQLGFYDLGHIQKHIAHVSDCHSTLEAGGASLVSSSKFVSRISKESLSRAQAIAQVDKKFILVKLINSDGMEQDHARKPVSLVLIDQHAADERVHVEDLYEQLCAPLAAEAQGYKSTLGHKSLVACTILEQPLLFTVSKQERSYLVQHAAMFANWGILVDIVDSTQDAERAGTMLSVKALPPVILERCKADPALLISLLRSTVWEFAGDSRLRPSPSCTGGVSSRDWATKLVHCPPPLLEIVHSRACRSAIMFNDELDVEQCTQLLQRLAACKFPFICAHGRPSMVTIADLGLSGGGIAQLGCEQQTDQNFVQAWRRSRN
ncbi:DNA mismatch repair protein [Paraphoma chrysanthemicola]|uniref:DNA mismatch repair protein n=1 Tax=Paraphoma chrysanthemicola TaxID=798071 RepID=A0A8K0RFN8_9PLEO|nr:DNA mismatch repair protein [Paraphoma chrysanthemicola]